MLTLKKANGLSLEVHMSMEASMKKGQHTDVVFTGELENGELASEFVGCNFTALSMKGVRLTGKFKGCDFTPASARIVREDVVWSGSFNDCPGVGRQK
jgi:hypothetical protein